MPAARGVKRTASKASTAASAAPKNKKKRAIQLEVPKLPKVRGCVFTCGQGDVGQLGLGEDVIETTKFKQVSVLGNKIVAISAGGMHTVALDSSGKVWTYGCNDEGALGRATASDKEEGTPGRVQLPLPAAMVTAGDSHSAALLHNGDVYAWGAFRDSHGSMGLVVRNREGKPCKDPVKVQIGEPAAEIASGSDHLVILTTSGAVFTMGCGEQGQLGRLSQRSASRDARQGFSALLLPSKVPLKAVGSRVWAGYHATFVYDATTDKMFAFGLNNYTQLGISGEKRKTAIFAPTECTLFQGGGWKAVAPGQHHSLALNQSGQVFSLGRCEYGRLGLGERSTDAEVLEAVPKLQDAKCISIAAGTSNSFAVTDNGEIFSWGMGSEGQLGTGTANDANEPTPGIVVSLANLVPRHIAAGGQHTVLLAEDPAAPKESTPEPEETESDEKMEVVENKPEAGDDKRRNKRQKPEQTPVEAKPQKVNGDDKTSPMDVDDETDNKPDTEKETEKMQTEEVEEKQEKTEGETAETSQPETTDTSSQDTDKSSQKSDENSQDSQASKTEENTAETQSDVAEKQSEIKDKQPEIKEKQPEIKEKQEKTDVSSQEINGKEELDKKETNSLTA